MADPRFLDGPVPYAERNATINYTGGSLTASRGVLAAMFTGNVALATCSPETTERSRKTFVRTEYIGADVRTVNGSTWTETKYPNQTKSIAAGGEPIRLRINGEYWTARLSGTHSALMAFLCSQNVAGGLDGVVSFMSERGTTYGPVGTPKESN